MGVFTRLAEPELAELAAAFALGAVHACTPIAAGTINSNFAVDTDRGRFFLRINEGKAEADVAWEAQLVTALAAAGLATPPPLLAHGQPYAPLGEKWVSVFPWRPGHHVLDVTADHVRTIGAALAALHRAAAGFTPRRSIYDHDHLVARFARFADSRDPALAPAIAILGDELAMLERARELRARAPHGLIHGDLFRDNVLWEGGHLVAILDFEQASSGSFAYDLAVCLNDWCWTDAPRFELAASLIAGYGPIDREALLIEVRAAAARFTITRITDVYLAGVDNPEKDFRAFLARCEAWRGQALGQLAAAL